MFDSLIDNLNAEKWQEVESKTPDEWKEYHVNRHHKNLDDNTIAVMVAEDNGDPKSVEIKYCQAKKDPLKEIGVIDLLLSADEKEVLGIDLNGDIVVRKM